MKNRKNTSNFFIGLLLLLIFTALGACKKVDNHFAEVAGQPWASTDYPSAALVGDTVNVRGKLFIKDGGYIQVGNVRAVLINVQSTIGADGTEQDQVKFVITEEMGIGTEPVKLVAKGAILNLPTITIRQYAGIPQRTDTTLYVDQLTQFNPANLNSYQAAGVSLLVNSSIDATGNIWFDNPLGIFKVTGTGTENILHSGSVLTDTGGPFIINRIIGSVISYDGTTLSFSAAVRDDGDSTTNYVFKLCQYNLASKTVTTLNRTLVSKMIPKADSSPGAFEGSVAGLHIVAMSMRSDANNTLYFSNAYQVASPNADPNYWYSAEVSLGNNPFGPYVVSNICKLTAAGQVSSLFTFNSTVNSNVNPIFKVPGFPVAITSDYKISPDGHTAYVYDKSDGFGYSLLQYDLEKKLPLHSSGIYANYRFLSYDSDPSSRQTGNSIGTFIGFLINPNGDYALQPLPNGTILLGEGASIAALNNLDQTMYIFAGSEIGIGGAPAPAQTQTIGKAKNVLFNGGSAAYLVFCGVDKNGTVYYVSSATGIDLSSPPLTFYKIYSKKI